jgi:hypothetical protein
MFALQKLIIFSYKSTHMQLINLDDGTAIPIKKFSDIGIPDEPKMSDRELMALILTLKNTALIMYLKTKI